MTAALITAGITCMLIAALLAVMHWLAVRALNRWPGEDD